MVAFWIAVGVGGGGALLLHWLRLRQLTDPAERARQQRSTGIALAVFGVACLLFLFFSRRV